ncbi:amine oxidase catalytic domain-containing protein [Viridothelium virens]|uniref:Amine oxidase n=1 Tax=Viridothelium virens TaxID=1048519 RepID=A0A6A6H5D0_VIRVR|nr:amine oxidase catalytic domain-containing protein [Viridothelium virens]
MQLKLIALLVSAAAAQAIGDTRHKLLPPRLRANGQAGLDAQLSSRQLEASKAESGCSDGTITTTAPKSNIFAGLTDDEFADTTAFLHQQKFLNLTAVSNATAWDNIIVTIDLLQPNKSDAINYLDNGAPAPPRYAHATVQFGATLEPYVQEYQVGPLPITNQSAVTELNYIYNSGKGKQRIYNADAASIATFQYQVGTQVANITSRLINGTAIGSATDTLLIGGNDPVIHELNRTVQWNQFYAINTGFAVDETLLPTGLEFKTDITGRDPSKWSVIGWYYGGQFWPTTRAFMTAANSPDFKSLGLAVDGSFGSTDSQGAQLPHDDLYPPTALQPQGTRYAIDMEQQYVEWMGFSFYIGFTRDTGMQLHNVEYQGQRVIYELGLQEALAHYASIDPLQSATAYLDSYYGFGPSSFELVQGFDCPAYATYVNASFYTQEASHTHANAICLFEYDPGYPISRHIASDYTTVSKHADLILRSVATVGNYDYMFEYAFHIDGSIHVTVRASGYIQGAYYAENEEYGFHIHDVLSGNMHDHVLNYKLDLDVLGTKNSLMRSNVVPATVQYNWSPGVPRNTMKVERDFITNENDAQINWDYNGATTYTVVNKDQKNQYGEYRGYTVTPASGSIVHLTVQNSTDLGSSANWATNHLYAVQQHDSEPRSAYPYNNQDTNKPAVDFGKFINGESLDQEDIVLYFNLGMHHLPQTADLPVTVFTTAQSSMLIIPQNYIDYNPSKATIHNVRVNFNNGVVTDIDTFGTVVPQCQLDFGSVAANLSGYTGEIITPKYPYDPSAAQVANPGAA